MTINGSAPAMPAMFLDAATDQQVEKHLHATGGWREARRIVRQRLPEGAPRYEGEFPAGHDGLGLLGVSGEDVVARETCEAIRAGTLHAIRGTLQADILKEDQAQNECIFTLPFALCLMGDVQQYLIDNRAEHYYGVSVSGYHIAEASAGPVTELAFTLANGFTLPEICLARGMPIDEIAPRFSFIFSNALDPEYAVIGRVARPECLRGTAGRRQVLHAGTDHRSPVPGRWPLSATDLNPASPVARVRQVSRRGNRLDRPGGAAIMKRTQRCQGDHRRAAASVCSGVPHRPCNRFTGTREVSRTGYGERIHSV